ncbi:MAG: hypothetical protein M9894_22510 [Planctomycetes bacterium]|nr:hypothetical protein [Planctomycetota bacterium]
METRAAFDRADVDEVERVAEEFGRKHWAQWLSAVGVADALEDMFELEMRTVLVDGRDAYLMTAHDAEKLFPLLPPETRKDLRSAALLFGHVFDLIASQAHHLTSAEADRLKDRITGILDEPVEGLDPALVRTTIYFLVLSVGGAVGGIKAPVLRAVARRLWDSLSKGLGVESEREREALVALAERSRLEASLLERKATRPSRVRGAAPPADEAHTGDDRLGDDELRDRAAWETTVADGLDEL